MALLQVVFKICMIIFMYDRVLSSDNASKRILLGDTDYIDGRLRQMEMTMNAKIQEIEAKTQNMTRTIHVLQQKGKFQLDRVMVFNVTFSNISVISWRSVLLVGDLTL